MSQTAYDYVKSHRARRIEAGDRPIQSWLKAPAAQAMDELRAKTRLPMDELLSEAMIHYLEHLSRS